MESEENGGAMFSAIEKYGKVVHESTNISCFERSNVQINQEKTGKCNRKCLSWAICKYVQLFNYVWILYNRTDFYLLMDKLSQPNMAASSGLSGKMFSLQLWNI